MARTLRSFDSMDKVAYPTVCDFVSCVDFLYRHPEIQFVVDAGVFGFLASGWIREESFDFLRSMEISGSAWLCRAQRHASLSQGRCSSHWPIGLSIFVCLQLLFISSSESLACSAHEDPSVFYMYKTIENCCSFVRSVMRAILFA